MLLCRLLSMTQGHLQRMDLLHDDPQGLQVCTMPWQCVNWKAFAGTSFTRKLEDWLIKCDPSIDWLISYSVFLFFVICMLIVVNSNNSLLQSWLIWFWLNEISPVIKFQSTSGLNEKIFWIHFFGKGKNGKKVGKKTRGSHWPWKFVKYEQISGLEGQKTARKQPFSWLIFRLT